MFIVGLTGPTGAGKSLVAHGFSECGYTVIDADRVARRVVEPGSRCLQELVQAFGSAILLPDGGLDRKKLAQMAFSDPNSLEKLNQITHPAILDEIKTEFKIIENSGCHKVILDAPTLFESGAFRLCDKTVCVFADEEIRLKRILQRDEITKDEAAVRMRSQPNREYYCGKSDFIIENNGEANDVISAAKRLADSLVAH